MSVFESSLDAVAAALEVQRVLAVEPAVPVRVGLHEGEITFDGQGAYGDAVSLASRANLARRLGSDSNSSLTATGR